MFFLILLYVVAAALIIGVLSTLTKEEWKKVLVGLLIAMGIITIIITGTVHVKRNNQYKRGIAYMNEGYFSDALKIFEELGDYKESETLNVYCTIKINMRHVSPEHIMSQVKCKFRYIPEDYVGPFHEEIEKDRQYVFSDTFYNDCVARKEREEAFEKACYERRLEEARKAENSSSGKNKKRYIYIPPTVSKPYYTDPDDYDCPEDFADDAWGLDFDDWDDAYDYWENY